MGMHTLHQRTYLILPAAALFAWIATSAYAVKPEENRQSLEKGRLIYEQACIWCHGEEGKGDGPAGWYLGRYSAPRPRNFVAEGFKFRSTPSGELPSDQDLFRTVTRGIPGFMPSFGTLTEAERWQVIYYIKSFNPLFKNGTPPAIDIPMAPFPQSDKSVERGRIVYLRFGCQGCHGDDGRGNGPVSQANELRDGQGLSLAATDLTNRSSFKSGAGSRDIYRTLMTGLDGTPMPSFAHAFQDNEDDIWHLINYLFSLSALP